MGLSVSSLWQGGFNGLGSLWGSGSLANNSFSIVPIGTGSGAGVNSITIATTAPVPQGAMVLVLCADSATTPSNTASDSINGNYFRDYVFTGPVGTPQIQVGPYRFFNSAFLPVGTVLTVNGGTTNTEIVASAYYVTGMGSAIDPNGGNGASGTSTTPTTVDLPTAKANDMWLGLVAWNSNTTLSLPSPWIGLTGVSTAALSIGWAYQVVNSTGSIHYAPTLGVSAAWASIIGAYQMAL